MQETCELKRKREKVNFSGLLTSVVHWSVHHWSLHRVSIASPGNVVQGWGQVMVLYAARSSLGSGCSKSIGLSLTLCSCPKGVVLQVKWTPAKLVGKNTSGSVFRISCSMWQLPKSRANELYKTHRWLFRVKSMCVFSGKPCICRHLIVKGELYNRLKEVGVCTHPAGRRACKAGNMIPCSQVLKLKSWNSSMADANKAVLLRLSPLLETSLEILCHGFPKYSK